MTQNPQMKKRARLIVEAMEQRNESQQWEEFIVAMLNKLELPLDKRMAAEGRYKQFGRHIANKLGVADTDVHVIVQGSMRTQTTIAGDGREDFDLDVAVKLSGAQFEGLRDSETFFQRFGNALEGLEGSGKPTPKNRCWRLPYPGEPFYFDVTPAIPKSGDITGTDLRVRDPITNWSPSNPEDFAEWFCEIANQRFPFQEEQIRKSFVEAKTTIDPIPKEKVHINDILRRIVQLMKLHRDGYYKKQSDARKEGKPISVILVTLAAKAYKELVTTEPHLYSSAIEVALEVVDRMPNFILSGSEIRVDNPALKGTRGENFADKWNHDNGLRANEFDEWQTQLVADLDALFSEEYSKRTEFRIRNVFGEPGVKAWKGNVLEGLLSTAPSLSKSEPQAPRPSGNRKTLA